MSTQIIPPQNASIQGYGPSRCDEPEVNDASQLQTERVQLTLGAHCYHGPTSLPSNWDRFQVTHSNNPGDWVSVWCDGSPTPHKIHPAGEDFHGDFLHCASSEDGTTVFYAEGHGTINFQALTYK